MTPKAKKGLLVVGGLAILGAVGYLLYSSSQSPQLPPGGGGGGGGGGGTANKPTAAQIKAFQDATLALEKFMAYVQANPPKTQAELDALNKKRDELYATYVATAKAAGAELRY